MKARYAPVALLFGASALATSGVQAPADPSGRYGFNWSEPEGARCVLVDAALKRKLGPCVKPDTPSFTGGTDHLACPIGKGEFLAFPTRERCQDELETMQANGD
jgi:hypothetical protein